MRPTEGKYVLSISLGICQFGSFIYMEFCYQSLATLLSLRIMFSKVQQSKQHASRTSFVPYSLPNNILLRRQNTFCIAIHQFMDIWVCFCFELWCIITHVDIHDIHISFHFPVYILRSGIAGSNGNSMFTFIRKCKSVFLRGCTILHSYQQSKFSTFSPTPAYLHFLFYCKNHRLIK